MLDRATLERLSQAPEKNAPMLNVALAEEGHGGVLLGLARCAVVGPEALAVIGTRIEAAGPEVGRDPEARPDEPFAPIHDELDQALIAHPQAPDALRDAILARHERDAFFVLAAACHPGATAHAIELAVDWPALSPVHDRLWLALLDPARVPPLTAEEWAQDASPRRREAVARISHETALIEALSRDEDRRVRRAVASNRHAAAVAARTRLAASDVAAEVRARAAVALSWHEGAEGGGGAVVETAKFAASLRAMRSLGVLAPDVRQALAAAGKDLDEEGAAIAARVLPRADVGLLLDHIAGGGAGSPAARGFAAGLSLRAPVHGDEGDDGDGEGDLVAVVYDAVKPLARMQTTAATLTGKAKLAAWMADGLATCAHVSVETMAEQMSRGSLGGDRMVLARAAAKDRTFLSALVAAALRREVVPAALLELAWMDASIEDGRVLELAARIQKPKKRAEDLPEDEVDLDPTCRSIEMLERTVLSAALRANVSPRAALAAIALDARRVRYVLTAMPQWKGRLSGGKLARVLRQNAGALSAAQAEARTRASRVEGWTERVLPELELSIAVAVGHVTGAEVARRLTIGRQHLSDGLSLAAGALARAAIEGPAAVLPILEWAAKNRAATPPALATWLLLEQLDRERAPSLIASAVDKLAMSNVGVLPAVCDALAALEHKRPGRLEGIFPQSPRGRATLASGLARAYRAIGGMRDERQDG